MLTRPWTVVSPRIEIDYFGLLSFLDIDISPQSLQGLLPSFQSHFLCVVQSVLYFSNSEQHSISQAVLSD